MTCPEDERLDHWLDEALPPTEATVLAAHVADTVACDAGCVLAPNVFVPIEPFAPLIDKAQIVGVLGGKFQGKVFVR